MFSVWREISVFPGGQEGALPKDQAPFPLVRSHSRVDKSAEDALAEAVTRRDRGVPESVGNRMGEVIPLDTGEADIPGVQGGSASGG